MEYLLFSIFSQIEIRLLRLLNSCMYIACNYFSDRFITDDVMYHAGGRKLDSNMLLKVTLVLEGKSYLRNVQSS